MTAIESDEFSDRREATARPAVPPLRSEEEGGSQPRDSGLARFAHAAAPSQRVGSKREDAPDDHVVKGLAGELGGVGRRRALAELPVVVGTALHGRLVELASCIVAARAGD